MHFKGLLLFLVHLRKENCLQKMTKSYLSVIWLKYSCRLLGNSIDSPPCLFQTNQKSKQFLVQTNLHYRNSGKLESAGK